MRRPSDVVLLPTSQAGHRGALVLERDDFSWGFLLKRSFVRPDKLVTLNRSLVVHRIGILTETAFARVHEAVCFYLGCLNNGG